ncbi:hypothetical protein [Halocola ammonii]
MEKIMLAIMLWLVGIISCGVNPIDDMNSVQVWRTELIKMNADTIYLTDSLVDRSQYLYLYNQGKAKLVDSFPDGKVLESETTWEIRNVKGKDVFLFGYGKESHGILGVAYPITTKNETDFKMAFDSLGEHNVWNLTRIKD